MRALALLSAALVVVASTFALAQTNVPEAPSADPSPVEASAPAAAVSLARALDARMTVWRRPGGDPVHVSHCRAGRHGSCRARVALFARWIAEVAREHHLDAFVLAAMAVRESGLNPFARGAAGEYGLIQLHPRGVGRRVRFVQSEAFRNRCRREPGACQREVLTIGARYLADAVAHCGGLDAGLTAYNRGECGESDYARRVLRERERLLQLAKDRDEGRSRSEI